MTKDQEDNFRRIAEDIVRVVPARRVVIFGSRASGTATKESDLDILVIEDEPFGPNHSRREEMRRVRGSLRHQRMPKDILVFSADEIDYWSESPSHVTSVALREGTVIYERP